MLTESLLGLLLKNGENQQYDPTSLPPYPTPKPIFSRKWRYLAYNRNSPHL
jgi:hypothetical protein